MDKRRYLSSLADELRVQQNRVRDLIGRNHWLSDGHHKEYVLASLIGRYLPAGIRLRRAFVVDSEDESCSREIDLALIDETRGSPVFDEGGLAIVLASSLCAAVSVKTTLSADSIRGSVENLDSVRRLMPETGLESCPLWTGAFFYCSQSPAPKSARILGEALAKLLKERPESLPAVDVLAAAPDLYIRSGLHQEGIAVRAFSAPELAPALFVAALLQHVAEWKGGAATGLGDLFHASDATLLETIYPKVEEGGSDEVPVSP